VNQSFITGLTTAGTVGGIAVDGTHIYWVVNRLSSTNPFGTIGRANLDGAGVNQSFISGLTSPGDIAVLPVPEPTTGLLVMGGVLGLAVSRRRAGVSA
jgi:hypothetical protein